MREYTMPWQPNKTTAGPYVTGSMDGRLRELEAQDVEQRAPSATDDRWIVRRSCRGTMRLL
jgi:hypothetical protein